KIAGVERIVGVTPPRTVLENPAIAAAIVELNLTEVYQVGGAQAIAALAFGTETVPRVDKITGPGNKYVAAAKKLVFGTVGIDSIAGPTEVIITADAESLAAKIKHAGAIFFGEFTPEAVGDYFAGPNHILPTCGTARFSSALGVYDFVKRTTLLRYSENEMKRAAPMIAAIAE